MTAHTRTALVATVLLASFLPPSLRAQSSGITVAAVVNGKVILSSEVNDALQAQAQLLNMQLRNDTTRLKQELSKLTPAVALDSLIDRELVLSEFQKMGGTIKPQYVEDDINGIVRDNFKGDRDAFVNELAKSGMTMKKFRDLRQKMIVVNVMRGRHTADQPPTTPREVADFYAKNIDKFRDGDAIKISTITIPKFTGNAEDTPEKQKQLAQEIRSKIAAGADFATMAGSYSQDSRAKEGGAMEWTERKVMNPTMADAAFALKTGGLSQVLDQESAYVIIYCDAKKLGDAVPLEKVRADIEKAVQNEKSREALETWMAGLRRKAVIRRMDGAPSAPAARPVVAQ